jgi:hypothetical protein
LAGGSDAVSGGSPAPLSAFVNGSWLCLRMPDGTLEMLMLGPASTCGWDAVVGSEKQHLLDRPRFKPPEWVTSELDVELQ